MRHVSIGMRQIFLWTLVSSAVFAQTAFDVVSIKPSHDMMAEPHRMGCSGATFLATGEFVHYMLQWTYDIQAF